MTLNEFLDEYEELSDKRRLKGLMSFLESMKFHVDEFEYVVKNWAEDVRHHEQDDTFGTEGMDV